MSDEEAKESLVEMLNSFTTGSILHLLAEVISEAELSGNSDQIDERRKQIEHTLIVVGLGIDAALPT